MAACEWDAVRIHGRALLDAGEDTEALESVAAAAWWLDDEPALFDARERLFRLYRSCGDDQAAAHVALRLSWDSTLFRGDTAAARGWAARSRRLLDTVRSADLAMLLVRESVWESDPAAARAVLGKAAEIAREVNAFEVELLASVFDGMRLVSMGHLDEAWAHLDEAILAACTGELTDQLVVMLACCQTLEACAKVGDFDRGREWSARVAVIAERVNSEGVLAVSRCLYAPLLRSRGDFAATDSLLNEALRYFDERVPSQSPLVLVELAELRRRQGRPAQAMRLLQRAEAAVRCRLVRAQLALDAGDWEAAAESAAAYLRQSGPPDHLARSEALVVLARAQANASRLSEARVAAHAAAEVAATIATPATMAAAQVAVGTVLAADGDAAAAGEALGDAVDTYARAGMEFEVARTRLQLAETLSALGRDKDAEEQRRASAAGLAQLRTGTARQLLTHRERDIARMIAAGLSDGAIARRLKISEHTVHRHVANLRARLGVPSRAAAVARAQELDLL